MSIRVLLHQSKNMVPLWSSMVANKACYTFLSCRMNRYLMSSCNFSVILNGQQGPSFIGALNCEKNSPEITKLTMSLREFC